MSGTDSLNSQTGRSQNEGDKYKIVFSGKIKEGASLPHVKQAIANLFKLDDAGIAKFFSGEPRPIKSNISLQNAQKYKMAFEQTGAICAIETVQDTPNTPPPPPPAKPPKSPAPPKPSPFPKPPAALQAQHPLKPPITPNRQAPPPQQAPAPSHPYPSMPQQKPPAPPQPPSSVIPPPTPAPPQKENGLVLESPLAPKTKPFSPKAIPSSEG